MLGVSAAPAYFAGLLIGARLYGLASYEAYRRVTFLLVVASALIALLPLDEGSGRGTECNSCRRCEGPASPPLP